MKVDYACKYPLNSSNPETKQSFCDNCNRQVTDCRTLSSSSVRSLVEKQKGQFCGIFSSSQLKNTAWDRRENVMLLRRFVMASVLVFGSALYTNAQELKGGIEQSLQERHVNSQNQDEVIFLRLVDHRTGNVMMERDNITIEVFDTKDEMVMEYAPGSAVIDRNGLSISTEGFISGNDYIIKVSVKGYMSEKYKITYSPMVQNTVHTIDMMAGADFRVIGCPSF